MPKRLPIKALKDLAKEQGLSHAILFAYDGELNHVVTYGQAVEECSQAADFGNELKKVLGWPETLRAQPSTVERLQNRIKELEDTLKISGYYGAKE